MKSSEERIRVHKAAEAVSLDGDAFFKVDLEMFLVFFIRQRPERG